MTPEQLAAEIEASRFTPVVITGGYDMRQVDAFLQELVQGLRAGHDIRPLASRGGFPVVRFRESYRIEDVEALLRRIRTVELTGVEPVVVPAEPSPGKRAYSPYTAPSFGEAHHPTHQVPTSATSRLLRRLRRRG